MQDVKSSINKMKITLLSRDSLEEPISSSIYFLPVEKEIKQLIEPSFMIQFTIL